MQTWLMISNMPVSNVNIYIYSNLLGVYNMLYGRRLKGMTILTNQG